MAIAKDNIKKKVSHQVQKNYKQGQLATTYLNHGLSKAEKVAFVKKVLFEHENLDLTQYKPFIH